MMDKGVKWKKEWETTSDHKQYIYIYIAKSDSIGMINDLGARSSFPAAMITKLRPDDQIRMMYDSIIQGITKTRAKQESGA